MPLTTPEFGAERGQAGETSFTRSKKHNFANLYQMNRADDQLKGKADDLQKGANAVNAQMADQVKKASGKPTGQAQSGAIPAPTGPKGMNPIGNYQNQVSQPGAAPDGSSVNRVDPYSQRTTDYIVNQAKGISNQAQNFSVENEAMKAGLSPTQAAITGFYAGSSNPAIAQIRQFSNLYNTALGKQAEINGLRSRQQATKTIPAPTTKKFTPPNWGPMQQQKNDEQNQNLRNQYGDTGVRTNSKDPLMAALRAGKITGDEYYAAQGGPGTPGYDAIKRKLSW